MLRALLILLLVGCKLACYGQAFHWPASYAVKVPRAVYLRLKEQVQVKEHWGAAPDKFTYLPVFNVLRPKQREFTDGIYYNIGSVHDSGRLFIYHQEKVIFLRSTSTRVILADYSAFIRTHPVPERTQIAYLSVVAEFMEFLQTE